MGSTGIKAHKPTPDPSRREGRSLPPTPSEGGGAASLRGISLHAVCTPLLRRFLSPGGGTEGGLKTIERGRFPGVGGGSQWEASLGRAHDLPVFNQNQNSPYD